MRKAPESNEIDNPLLAERMSGKTYQNPSNYKVPQDVILEKKHSKQMSDIQETSNRNKSREPKARERSHKRDESDDRLIRTKSKDKLTRDKSNEDLSMSSQSKAQQTQKRQWKAPTATSFNDYNDDNQNQKTGNFNSLVNDAPAKVEPKVEVQKQKTEEPKPAAQEIQITTTAPDTSAAPKKSLFGGSKKNVFNPFAKKAGAKPGGSGAGAGLGGTNTSFT